MPVMVPEKAVLKLLLPTVRLLAPRKTFPPLPSIDPIVTPGASWALMSRLMGNPGNSTNRICAVPPLEESPKETATASPPENRAIVALPALEESPKLTKAPPSVASSRPVEKVRCASVQAHATGSGSVEKVRCVVTVKFRAAGTGRVEKVRCASY